MTVAEGIERVQIDGERWYVIPTPNGVLRLPSATTVLEHGFPKLWLVAWRERLILDHIRQGLAGGASTGGEELKALLAAAQQVPNERVARACEFGTALHDAVQARLESGKYPREYRDDPALRPCLEGFERWWRAQRMQPVEVECVVWSETFGFAGTCDAICRLPDRSLVCCDWKSSARLSISNAAQATAYALCYEEVTGERVRHVWVVRIDKRCGQVEVLRVARADRAILMKGFLGALDVFRLTHDYKPVPQRWPTST